MSKKIRILVLLAVLPAFMSLICSAQEAADEALIAKIDSGLQKLLEVQQDIIHIHPILEGLHPVAIVSGEHLFIFDVDSTSGMYRFQEKQPVPFPMPQGIKASFPLSGYGGRPTCFVGKDIFDAMKGYATVFHEFVHCSQALTCENALKMRLKIAQDAMKAQNYSWELNHAFPYEDSIFVTDYSDFLEAMGNNNHDGIKETRSKLKAYLNQADFEYLVWQEWKEGFARLIENRIRSVYDLEKNEGGGEQPYNRVTFYYGGSRFIDYITQKEKALYTDIAALFEYIREFPNNQ